MYDPDLYRTKEEIERWKQRDPIAALAERLRAAGAARRRGAGSDRGGGRPTRSTPRVAFAEAGTLEPVEELERFVYAEECARERRGHDRR